MFCGNCGAKVDQSMSHCPGCGRPLPGAQAGLEYSRAEALEASGDYESARDAFLALGGYSDSADRAAALSGSRGAGPGAASSAASGLQGAASGAADALSRWQRSNAPRASSQHTDEGTVLADGEIVVRRYTCTQMRQFLAPDIYGRLTVTNKRVVFTGSGDKSLVGAEVVLDSVSGLSCSYGTNYDWRTILIGVLLALAGLFLTLYVNPLFLLLLAFGVLFAWGGVRPAFKLDVFSSKASGSPISVGEGATSLTGNRAALSLSSSPTDDTARMLNELGALVMDLQTLGDNAIEKWKG